MNVEDHVCFNVKGVDFVLYRRPNSRNKLVMIFLVFILMLVSLFRLFRFLIF